MTWSWVFYPGAHQTDHTTEGPSKHSPDETWLCWHIKTILWLKKEWERTRRYNDGYGSKNANHDDDFNNKMKTRFYIFWRNETVRLSCVWFADGSVLGLVYKALSSVIFTEDKVLVSVILCENLQKSASLSLIILTLKLTVTLKLTLTPTQK